ncbi:DUF3325 family protein [Pacificimonas sp. ICDLI1SI03]
MSGLPSFIVVLALTYVGFLLLARSQAKYRPPPVWAARIPPYRLRLFGGFLLVLALAVALQMQGVGFGSLLWVLTLAAGAGMVVLRLATSAR